jgi:putative endonuclease
MYIASEGDVEYRRQHRNGRKYAETLWLPLATLMQVWHVYFVRTRFGSLYAGAAIDVARRLAEHEHVNGRGAKYLRSKGPLEIAYQAAIGDRALALKVESGMKKLNKSQKESIVSTTPAGDELLQLLGLSEDDAS